MKKEKTVYDPIVEQFKLIVRAYAKASGSSIEESVDLLVPVILAAIDKQLRNAFNN